MQARRAAGVAGALGLVGVLATLLADRRRAARLGHWLRGRGRHLRGRLRGLAYRLRGGHPDPDVPDVVLAQRVRSSLGPLLKRRDLPHVNVDVTNRMAVLHGVVGSADDAHEIEQFVLRVPGITSVLSQLHIGFGPGDTRPSVGRRMHAATA